MALGDGPKARLKFDLDRARQALDARQKGRTGRAAGEDQHDANFRAAPGEEQDCLVEECMYGSHAHRIDEPPL